MKNFFEIVSPEAAGISSSTMIRLIDAFDKLDSPHSIMMMRHGKLCLNACWKPYDTETPHMLFSLSKSFTSVAIGMAQAEKRVSINDKLVAFFPECDAFINDPAMRKVTLRDLLTMRSGHLECQIAKLNTVSDGDYVRGFLGTRLDTAPGERFAYNSAATYMLAAVIKRVSGFNVREYLLPRLFEPLGIAPGPWDSCPRGINYGGFGLHLSTADIAKFAQLLLMNGVWQGKRLIPAEYLAEATSVQADNSMNDAIDWQQGYGYQFWRSRHGYRGDGAHGQYAIVLPEQDIAIAINSSLANMQQELDCLWDVLLPGLSDNPLPENRTDQAALAAKIAALALKTQSGDLNRREPDAKFEFMHNPLGLHAAFVEFGSDECAISFEFDHGVEQLRAGFGSFRMSAVKLGDIKPHRVAASAAWSDDGRLEITELCLDGTFRTHYSFDFSGGKDAFTRTVEFSIFRPEWPAISTVRIAKYR